MNQNSEERAERALARIILPASCTMIGICATLIGLAKIVEGTGRPGHVDEYASLVLLLFLGSAGSSYAAIRHTAQRHLSSTFERLADSLFLAGLFAIAVVGLFFAYEII